MLVVKERNETLWTCRGAVTPSSRMIRRKALPECTSSGPKLRCFLSLKAKVECISSWKCAIHFSLTAN